MGLNAFRGDAAPVAQVNTVTPASVAIGNVFKIVINSKTVSYTAVAATVADVCTGLVAAVEAAQDTILEFNDVSASDNTTNLTLTAVTPGVPFTQSSIASTGTGTPGCTLATSVTTSSSGPEDWSVASNWTLGTTPADGDDVMLSQSAVSILYGLDQSAVTLNSLVMESTFTGDLGLPDYNLTGGYYEYRPKKLMIGATTALIGRGDGPGSNLIRIDFLADPVSLTVYSTGASSQQGVPTLLVEGDNALNTALVLSGSVGMGFDPGGDFNFPVVSVGFENSSSTDASVVCGDGAALGEVTVNGGTLTLQSDVTTLAVRAGTVTVQGSASADTVTLTGGTLVWNSSGTLGDVLKMQTGSFLDFSRAPGLACELTGTMEIGIGATVLDPLARVTWPEAPLGAVVADITRCTVDFGRNKVITPSDPS